MRLYYFTQQEHALTNIAKKRIRISRFNDLNDPFELLANSLADRDLRTAFIKLKNEFDKDNGLICFSENWRNPVMWSHYADKHRGMCLGFEVADSSAVKVTYSSRRLNYDLQSFNPENLNRHQDILKCFSTKFGHWRYEREYRVFVKLDHSTKDLKGNYFTGFNQCLQLKSIVVGPNSNLSRRDVSEAVLAGNHGSDLDIFKARTAFRTFRIVKIRDSKFWR
jgi:Protein of unknown function (DUF2971)